MCINLYGLDDTHWPLHTDTVTHFSINTQSQETQARVFCVTNHHIFLVEEVRTDIWLKTGHTV